MANLFLSIAASNPGVRNLDPGANFGMGIVLIVTLQFSTEWSRIRLQVSESSTLLSADRESSVFSLSENPISRLAGECSPQNLIFGNLY